MSSQQKYSEYLYFTLHHNSHISAEQIVQDYHLDKMNDLNYWDQGQLNDEHHHQFNVMCIRFTIGDVEYTQDLTSQILMWLHLFEYKTKFLQLPKDIIKTLHLVTHDSNDQGAGFHLSHQLLGALAEHDIQFSLHGYLDADDGQDFPFSQPVNHTILNQEYSEYAYFWLSSEQLNAIELQKLLPELCFEIRKNQGKVPNRSIHAKSFLNTSTVELTSSLDNSAPFDHHIENLCKQLQPYQQQLQHLFFHAHISFGINATGHLENPHHRTISASCLKQLFALGCDLDADLYFA